ncbi:RDD family protein [Mesorhizobium sp. NBSH29]|uniref:RDD family protein n=1 Tax=Mesorhizobium sp. NBSH29 TaxID=2654249 RepID=UPI001896A033|nr:RDD family protein [Mesorhizobium sp. NBSH29]QPC87365.1 RDD family protein [Mesorhizobium sp. NBSH29]
MNTTTAPENTHSNHWDEPRLYSGVLTNRVFAFMIDYLIIGLLLIPVAILVFFLGILTLGLGWLLFGILGPLVALTYVWKTLGGVNQATLGMKMMGIQLERLDGRPVDGMLAVVHTVLFWAGNTVLTPLILLAALFTDRKRTVHDLLLGTVVIRSSP